MYKLNLEIGSITISLGFEDENIVKHFEEYFLSKSSTKKPDMSIKVHFFYNEDVTEVPNSLFLTKKAGNGSFEAGNGLIKGNYDVEKKSGELFVHYLIVKGEYTRVFEQILYQAFNSVAKEYNSTLIHSSGVIKDGFGYLFVGPSEAGKSTVAKLSQKYHVINDEVNIVNLMADVPTLESTPFNGLYREKEKGKAPLKGIFILNQAPKHSVEKISGGKAIKPLANEIIPPIGLDENLNPDTYIKMMDRAKDIFTQVPIYRLDFLPDPGFWDVISNLK